MDKIINAISPLIMGATIAAGVFIKKGLKGVKIGNFEVVRLLPIFILIVGEVLSIVYGLITDENIVLSVSSGLIVSAIAAFGYDIYKSLFGKGVASEDEKDKK